ncbi:MAG: PRD domain-containing protein [Firmicutes bacterium]|nr:PRD domain-containing protein [Bacillota bacterium]
MIDARRAKILSVITLQGNQPITVSRLARRLGVSPRTIRYDLEAIDDWLSANGFSVLRRKPRTGVSLDGGRADLTTILGRLSESTPREYNLSKDERRLAILSSLLDATTALSIGSLARKLMVSYRTVTQDLQAVSAWLESRGLTLQRRRGEGILVRGPEPCRRRAVTDLITECLGAEQVAECVQGKEPVLPAGLTPWPAVPRLREMFSGVDLTRLEHIIRAAEAELGVTFADRSFGTLMLHLAVAVKRLSEGHKIEMGPSELEDLSHRKEFETARHMVAQIEHEFGIIVPDAEAGFITLHLLGAKIQANTSAESAGIGGPAHEARLPDHLQDSEAMRVAEEIAEYAGLRLGVRLRDDQQLMLWLALHLKPALHRLKFGLPISNPLSDYVKQSYPAIFTATAEACRGLEFRFGRPVSNEEIGYIAMHIGAAVERQRRAHPTPRRVVVVCGTGAGTSAILTSRLEAEFEGVQVIRQVGYRDVASDTARVTEGADAVVTTVALPGLPVPVVEVNPLLLPNDIARLRDAGFRPAGGELPCNLAPLVKDITDTVNEFAEVKCVGPMQGKIMALLRKFLWSKGGLLGGVMPMLSDVLTERTIRLKVPASDWQSAVRSAGEVLVGDKAVEPRYVDAMVDMIHELGCYVVICPGVAMPHARPENGVHRVAISLITLDKPVEFGHPENDPVDVIVALAATDNSSHLLALSQLMEFLGAPGNLETIRIASCPGAVSALVRRGASGGPQAAGAAKEGAAE